MHNDFRISLTHIEAEEIALAAGHALADAEFLDYPDTNADALVSAVRKVSAARPQSRIRRLSAVGVKVSTVAAALLIGAAALAPSQLAPADAASPFDHPTWRAMVVAGGWHCEGAGDRLEQCEADNGVTARVEAYTGPDGTTFILIYDVGNTTHRDELRVYTDPGGAARILAAAKDDPGAYPNLRTGPGWVMTSTDPALALAAASDDVQVEAPARFGVVPPAIHQEVMRQIRGKVRSILGDPAAAPGTVDGATVSNVTVGEGDPAVVVVVPDAPTTPPASAPAVPPTVDLPAPVYPEAPRNDPLPAPAEPAPSLPAPEPPPAAEPAPPAQEPAPPADEPVATPRDAPSDEPPSDEPPSDGE